MADFFTAFPAQGIKPQAGMSLGEMINIARGAQELQQAQRMNPLTVQRAEAELSRLQQLTPEEVARAVAERKVAEQTVEPRISAAQSQAGTAATQFNTAQLENARAHYANSSRELIKLLDRKDLSPTDVSSFVKETMKNMGASDAAISQGLSEIPQTASTPELKAWIARHAANSLSAEAHIDRLFPSAQMVSTGAGAVPITMGSPYLAVSPPGTRAGKSVTAEPPPTTELIARPGDGTGLPPGTKYMIGPKEPQSGKQGPMVTGMGPGETAATLMPAEQFAKDWPTTQADATQALGRIAIFQNIKKLTPEAFTGPTADRRQAIASFAQVVGIPAYELETATTDELMKNTKLLQLAGGNTDAARSLAEFANPNTKMTKEGIARVVNQLMGIENMKVARANYLGQFTDDPVKYAEAMRNFGSISDPRLFQEMSKEDKDKLVKSLSKSEYDDLIKQVRLARQLGVIR